MKKSIPVEPVLIALFIAGMILCRRQRPSEMDPGYVILIFGLFFLLQTLLRDAWLPGRLRGSDRRAPEHIHFRLPLRG